MAAARELLDRGYGRPLQMIDALALRKKLSDLSPDEITALEARLLTDAAADMDGGQAISSSEQAAGRLIDALLDLVRLHRSSLLDGRVRHDLRADALPLHLHDDSDQTATFFEAVATEVLFGGAAGGGKSYLMRVAAIV